MSNWIISVVRIADSALSPRFVFVGGVKCPDERRTTIRFLNTCSQRVSRTRLIRCFLQHLYRYLMTYDRREDSYFAWTRQDPCYFTFNPIVGSFAKLTRWKMKDLLILELSLNCRPVISVKCILFVGYRRTVNKLLFILQLKFLYNYLLNLVSFIGNLQFSILIP